jgi:hypothetical protein
MSLNFPSSPALDTLYTLGTRTWKFNGEGWEVVPPQGELGYTGSKGDIGLDPWTVVSSNYTASNKNRLIADGTAGSFDITLPETPSAGDYIQITDGANFNLYPITILRNGNTIEGFSENVLLDLPGSTFEFIYDGATWHITSTSGPQGFTGSAGAGADGSQGDTGFTGSQGYDGSQGFTGSQGTNGFDGSQGFTGSQGAGFTGSQGELGYTGSMGFTGSQGVQGGMSSVQEINTQTGTTYSFVTSDAGKLISFDNNSPITVTVPSDSTLTFSIGQRIDVVQVGAGSVFFEAAAGVTLQYSGSNYLAADNQSATFIKVAANEWLFIGPGSTGYTGSQGELGYTGSIGYTGSQGVPGGMSSIQSINTQTGTTYSFVTSDAGKLVTFDNNSPITVTIPSDTTLPFSVGQRIDLTQVGLGSVFFEVEAGVVLQYSGSNYLAADNQSATLIKIAGNEWLFIGPNVGYTGSIGYTGSQGFTGSQGDIGYTGSQGITGYTGSYGDLGPRGFTGSQGVGFTGSASTVAGFTGSRGDSGFTGSVGTTSLERHFNYPGNVAVSVGTARWYLQQTTIVQRIKAQITTAPVGSNMTINIKKNDTTLQVISITDGTNSTLLNTNISMADGDYLTVDIVTVGASTPGADLVISFLYVRV